MQGSGAYWPGPQGAWGPAPRLKSWSEDGNPTSHSSETQQEVKNLAYRKAANESGGNPGPKTCGPGLQGAWGPGPQGLGPPGLGARPARGLGPFPRKKITQTSQNYDFSQTSWWEPGEGVGVG